MKFIDVRLEVDITSDPENPYVSSYQVMDSNLSDDQKIAVHDSLDSDDAVSFFDALTTDLVVNNPLYEGLVKGDKNV